MNITDLIQVLGTNLWLYGGSLILVLSILVFVHEWGHYIVARMCGVRVEIFSIGFGKELFGFYDRKGTRWKISLIPLGGYVKLFGDTNPASAGHTDMVQLADGLVRKMTAEEQKAAFFRKPIWQKAAVVFAGPAINFIFAILILAGLYVSYGQPIIPPTAAAIVAGSNADKYGFKPHDKIISIDGKAVVGFQDVRREVMVALDQEKTFVVERDGQKLTIKARAERKQRTDRFGFKSETGVLGIISAEEGLQVSKISKIDGVAYSDVPSIITALKGRMGKTFKVEIIREGRESDEYIIAPEIDRNDKLGTEKDPETEILFLSKFAAKEFKNHTPMTALQSAIQETYVLTRSSLEALGQIITGVRSTNELGGIIRIGAIAGDMAAQGIIPLILLTAFLSINLGFINLLPIPVLDGGHLTFYAIEAILGKPIPEKIQEYAFNVGFVFLIGVMAFANLNDVWQLISNKG